MIACSLGRGGSINRGFNSDHYDPDWLLLLVVRVEFREIWTLIGDSHIKACRRMSLDTKYSFCVDVVVTELE